MRPTDCPACQQAFLDDPLLQAEAQHEVTKFGLAAGMSLVDEKLEEFHVNGHGQEPQ
jgi:hypothetical protein